MKSTATDPDANVAESTGTLKRAIGSVQYFTLAFGAIIGVGWVIVLGEWLDQAGPLGAMLAFGAGAILMMLIGLCYAEVATLLPVAGGEVAYAHEVFGVRSAYAVGWLLGLAYVGVTTFEAISIGWVVAALFPALEGPVLYTSLGAPVHLGDIVIGVGGMSLLTWFNYRGGGSAARLQDILTFVLLGLSLVFIGSGLVWGDPANLRPYFGSGGGDGLAGMFAVFMTVPFWFSGFNVIPQALEEVSEGTRLAVVGKMVLLSIGLAAVFYCLVILSASMTQPWQQLLDADLPAAAAFEGAFPIAGIGKVVLLAALLGLVTTWNTTFLGGARVLFALGRAHLIPTTFGRVQGRYGSPGHAVLFVGSVGTIGAFAGRNAITPIVNLSGICFAVAFLVTAACLIQLRRTRPHAVRPYRAPGGSLTAGLAVAGSIFILLLAINQLFLKPTGVSTEGVVLGTWVVLGAVFWRLARRPREALTGAERRKLILAALSHPGDDLDRGGER